MKLAWIGESELTDADRRKWPQGYWGASTDDGAWDAVGADPLAAVSNLVTELERGLRRNP